MNGDTDQQLLATLRLQSCGIAVAHFCRDSSIPLAVAFNQKSSRS